MLKIRWILLSVLVAFCLSVASCARDAQQSASTQPTTAPTATPVAVSPTVDGAEAFYEQLLRENGKDCTDCLQPLELQTGPTPQPDGTAQASPAQKPLNVLVMLDSSGSMAEDIGGEPKMTAAKAAITQFVQQLPDTAEVGLLVYGHKGSNRPADKAVSCAGIDTVYPLSKLDRAKFEAAVNSFEPTGYTPIAAALQRAGQVLPPSEDRQNVVYIVSDGLETCGGNPVTQARSLNTQAKVIVNIIGLNVDDESRQQLEAIAQAGGGKFYPANSGDQINSVFDQVRNQTDRSLYQAQNQASQNLVSAVTQSTMDAVSACIDTTLNLESASFNSALNVLQPNDPNYGYRDAVQAKLAARQTAIRGWRDRLIQSYRNQENVTVSQLKQDLQSVQQQYGQTDAAAPTPQATDSPAATPTTSP